MNDVLVLAEVGVKAWKLRICGHVCLYFADHDNSIRNFTKPNYIKSIECNTVSLIPRPTQFCHSVGVAQKYIEAEEGEGLGAFII